MKYFLIITLMVAMSLPVTCLTVMTDSYEIPFVEQAVILLQGE